MANSKVVYGTISATVHVLENEQDGENMSCHVWRYDAECEQNSKKTRIKKLDFVCPEFDGKGRVATMITT